MPRGIRINAVSPTALEEAWEAYAPYFPGHRPVSAAGSRQGVRQVHRRRTNRPGIPRRLQTTVAAASVMAGHELAGVLAGHGRRSLPLPVVSAQELVILPKKPPGRSEIITWARRRSWGHWPRRHARSPRCSRWTTALNPPPLGPGSVHGSTDRLATAGGAIRHILERDERCKQWAGQFPVSGGLQEAPRHVWSTCLHQRFRQPVDGFHKRTGVARAEPVQTCSSKGFDRAFGESTAQCLQASLFVDGGHQLRRAHGVGEESCFGQHRV